MNRPEIHAKAFDCRINFERKRIDQAQLAQLYFAYNPLEEIHGFIAQAAELFPSLNCGIASAYLQSCFKTGNIIQGSYAGHNHTFLEMDDGTIVDITADQYGGPDVYVGPLKFPWSLQGANL